MALMLQLVSNWPIHAENSNFLGQVRLKLWAKTNQYVGDTMMMVMKQRASWVMNDWLKLWWQVVMMMMMANGIHVQ